MLNKKEKNSNISQENEKYNFNHKYHNNNYISTRI